MRWRACGLSGCSRVFASPPGFRRVPTKSSHQVRFLETATKVHKDPWPPRSASWASITTSRDSENALPHFRATQLLSSTTSLPQGPGHSELKISGFVKSFRRQKSATFVHLSDGSSRTFIQVIVAPEFGADLSNGAFVEARGRWIPSPGGKQGFELQASHIEVLGPCNAEKYPIQKHNLMKFNNLRTIPHLRLRTEFGSLIIRARATLLAALPSFFASSRRHRHCIQVQPPIITSSDCEGVGEVFTLIPRSSAAAQMEVEAVAPALVEHYFKEPKYLTVSSQLHLEAFSAELGDVWALSPTFRAEHSDTPRHLSEFYMFEVELRGVETLESIVAEVEKGIISLVLALQDAPAGKELLQHYATRAGDRIDLEDRWSRVTDHPWKVVTYTSAMEELIRAYALDPTLFERAPQWHSGLQLEHERWIVAKIGLNRPVFVTHYPASIKPFYMLPSSDDQDLGDMSTVACFDLLFPDGYCEIVGGSLREHRLENLIQNMRKAGLLEEKPLPFDIADAKLTRDYPFLKPEEDLGALKWYADLRRFGSSPHGGFGMGFDRLLAYLTGVANLRDVVPFPRTWGRADC